MISSPGIPWQTIDLTSKLNKMEGIKEAPDAASEKNDTKDIKEACAEFESLFISFMLKTMRDTIPKSGLLNGGMAEDVYTSMLDQELAKKMAERGGIGLSSLLVRQLDSAQTDKL